MLNCLKWYSKQIYICILEYLASEIVLLLLFQYTTVTQEEENGEYLDRISVLKAGNLNNTASADNLTGCLYEGFMSIYLTLCKSCRDIIRFREKYLKLLVCRLSTVPTFSYFFLLFLLFCFDPTFSYFFFKSSYYSYYFIKKWRKKVYVS